MADKQTEYRMWHGRLAALLASEIEDIRYDAFNEFDAKVNGGLIPVVAFKTMQRDFVLPIIQAHNLDMSDFYNAEASVLGSVSLADIKFWANLATRIGVSAANGNWRARDKKMYV
ncbi:hypothetical protein [Weissella cibaria]|uniref:hypothetical protein n=1 Tax=Weissella cibaria TaxID=137591 RepID=UPI0036D81F53